VHCDPKVLADVIHSPHESVTAIQKIAWEEEQVNVVTDDTMRIHHIGKHITEHDSHGEFIGVTKLSHNFIDSIKKTIELEGAETFRYSFAVDLINHVVNVHKKELHAVDVTTSHAIEIDTAEDLARAQA
jgi:choline kinase